MTFAAQEASIVGFHLKALPAGGLDVADTSPAALEEKVGWVRAAAGPRCEELEFSILVGEVAVTDAPPGCSRPKLAKR